jgi:hypothetical protein
MHTSKSLGLHNPPVTSTTLQRKNYLTWLVSNDLEYLLPVSLKSTYILVMSVRI